MYVCMHACTCSVYNLYSILSLFPTCMLVAFSYALIYLHTDTVSRNIDLYTTYYIHLWPALIFYQMHAVAFILFQFTKN